MRPLLPIALNQVATIGLGVAGIKLVSEFIPPAVNGPYALFVTLTQIGIFVGYPGLINHATRYWQRESHQAAVYARFLWRTTWHGLTRIAPLLLATVLAAAWAQGSAVWLWTFPLLVVSNVGLTLQYLATGILNAGGRPWHVFCLTTTGNAARFLMPIGIALLLAGGMRNGAGASAEQRLGGITFLNLSIGYAAHGLVLVGAVMFLFRWARSAAPPSPSIQKRWRRELQDYGRPFIVLGAGGWLLHSADRWIVEQFYGAEQAGLFAFASMLGAIIPTMLVGGLMQLVFPRVFRQADAAKTDADWRQIAKECDRVTLWFAGLALAGLLCLGWVGPLLVGSLISAKYAAALPMLIPAGLAMMTAQINQFYYLLLQGQHNSAAMARVMLVVSGVKTLGSIAAAAVSWTALLTWLIVSFALGGWIGRTMIRRLALKTAS